MASLYTKQSNNFLKTLFLMFLFTAIAILVAWFAADSLGNSIIIYVIGAIAALINIAAFWKSHEFIIKGNKG